MSPQAVATRGLYAPLPPKIQFPDLMSTISKAYPIETNPTLSEVEDDSYRWFENFGIYGAAKQKAFRKMDFGLFCAITFPQATAERLRLSMDFALWLFAYDDCIDDGQWKGAVELVQDASRLVLSTASIDSLGSPQEKFAYMLQDIVGRLSADTTEGFMRRFHEACIKYTNGTMKQTLNRAESTILSVKDFIDMRRGTSGVDMCWAILEYSLCLNLPNSVHDNPHIIDIEDSAHDILTWANDIYSSPIEYFRNDQQNLVRSAMVEMDLDVNEGLEFVSELIKQRVEDLHKAKNALESFGPEVDDQIDKYVQGVEFWIRGSIEWMFYTYRHFRGQGLNVRLTRCLDTQALQKSLRADSEEAKTGKVFE